MSYEEFTTENGLRVGLQHTPTETINGRLRINYGSVHEQQGEEGLAHFLEHNIATGGSASYSPEEAKKMFTHLGHLNLYTSMNETTIPSDFLTEDLPLYLNFISDIVSTPQFLTIDSERQRVIKEIHNKKSNNLYLFTQEYWKSFFGNDSPRLRETLGSEAVVFSATAKKLSDFHKRGYGASNMDLILAGNLPDNAEALIQSAFAKLPQGDSLKYTFAQPQLLQKGKEYQVPTPQLLNEKNPQQSNGVLEIHIPAPMFPHEDTYTVSLLCRILGDGLNSILHQEISEALGLAYNIHASYNSGERSHIHISTNINPATSERTMGAIFSCLGSVKEQLLPDETVQQCKRAVRYEFAKLLESNGGHVKAVETFFDSGLQTTDGLANFDRVTPEMIRDAARKYLPSTRHVCPYQSVFLNPLAE